MDFKEIFDRSNEIICRDINLYFPGGVTDRRGWYTLKNFDRGEKHVGSFGICVSGEKIGAVCDFADSSYNTNVTTFYANVNNLKPMDAAKKIIKDNDLNFYNLAWPPKNQTKYTPIIPIPEDVYKLDFEQYCLNDKRLSGNIDWIYEYRDIQGKLNYISIRLKTPFKDKKGNNRKLLSVGYFEHEKGPDKWKDFSWYKHPFAGKSYPFSRQDELSKLGKRNVLIVEGEKAAYFLEKVLNPDKWVITTIGASSYMYNSEAYNLFKKLKINHAFYWPDNDDPGKKTIGFIKERFDKLSVLKIPEEEYYFKGWDAADAVQDGWSSEDIEKFIFNNIYESEEIDPQFFKALSHDHENFYFMSYRLGLVKAVKQESITIGFLRIMAPLDFWINKYPENKRNSDLNNFNTNLAIEDIIEMGINTPYHENGLIRQLGAWEDDGRFVFHFGSGLLIDGKKESLFGFKSKNIYEKKGYLSFSENNLPEINLRKIAEIIKRFSIGDKQSKYFFIGWIVMSIIGGALKWRPHIWLTGEAGSGKTSAIDFVKKILDTACILETGSSTEAGIRQKLKVSTLPVLIDELENMDDKTNKNLKAIKALIRQASSGTRVSRGTSDHSGIDFAVQSMFCVGSISPQIAEKADLTRFTIINFDKSSQGTPKEWLETESMILDILTPEYINQFKYMMATNIKKVTELIKMSFKVFSDLEYNSRLSQQYSVLTIGAMICAMNGFDFSEEDYKLFLNRNFNFSEQEENVGGTAAEECMSYIFQKVIDHKNKDGFFDKSSIFELLNDYKKEREKDKNAFDINERPNEKYMQNIIKAVKSYGFLLDHELCSEEILFVYNSKYVKEALLNTQFSGEIKDILKRHPQYEGTETKTLYAGGRGAAIRFNYGILSDKIDDYCLAASKPDDEIPF